MKGRLSLLRRRRGTVAPPKPKQGLKLSRIEVGAIVIAVIVAISAVAYFTVYDKPSPGYFSEQLTVQIGRSASNATATYLPDNFTLSQGEHVSLVVQNTDNSAHGLAIPKFNQNTGEIAANGTATIAFVPNVVGNFTFDEPSTDCGGGTCDAGQALTGWFFVNATG